MRNAITYKDIYLSLPGFLCIRKIEIEEWPGKHGTLYVEAVMAEDADEFSFYELPEIVSVNYRDHGSTAGGQVRVQVRKDRSLKPLEKDGIKAFVNNIAERGQVRRRDTRKGRKGSAVRHMAIAQREGSERLHIQEKFSNSIPVMIGNEDTVYGVVEPHIQEMLQTSIDKEIDKILGR